MSLLVLLFLPATLHPRRSLGQDVAILTDDPLKETKVGVFANRLLDFQFRCEEARADLRAKQGESVRHATVMLLTSSMMSSWGRSGCPRSMLFLLSSLPVPVNQATHYLCVQLSFQSTIKDGILILAFTVQI